MEVWTLVITLSEQGSRKFEGSSIFSEKPRKITTEEGISVEGRISPEHSGRIKDISDAYQLKLFQSDYLESKGRIVKAGNVRTGSEKWLDLWGEQAAKDARLKAAQGRLDFLKDFEISVKPESKMKLPATPTQTALVAATIAAPIKSPVQKDVVIRSSSPVQKDVIIRSSSPVRKKM